MMSSASTTMTIRLDPQLKAKLGRLAEGTRRSRSFLAAEAVETYVDRELAIIEGIQRGVARGIFSNEAGLGTAGIAQAAGATRDPVYSGMIGMMGTFIDTLVICTMTALAIMVMSPSRMPFSLSQ